MSVSRLISSRKTLRTLLVPAILLATTGSVMGYFAMEMSRHIAETSTEDDSPAALHHRRDWVMAQLVAAGVTPEALAASGVPGNSIGSIIDAACEYSEDHGRGLATAQESVAAANSQARQAATPGLASVANSEPMSRQQTVAAGSSANAALAAEREAFLAAALAPISQTARITLDRLIAHKHWDLPVEFRSLELTEGQRLELRDALTVTRQHAAAGAQVDSRISELVASRRSAASAVKANLDANLAAVQAAWTQEQVR